MKRVATLAAANASIAKKPRIVPPDSGCARALAVKDVNKMSCVVDKSGKREDFTETAEARYDELIHGLVLKRETLERKSAEVQAAKSEDAAQRFRIRIAEDEAKSEVKRLEARLVEARLALQTCKRELPLLRWLDLCSSRRDAVLESRRADIKQIRTRIAKLADASRVHARELSALDAAVTAIDQERQACDKEVSIKLRELSDHEVLMSRANLMRFNSGKVECVICRDDLSAGGAALLGCGHGFYCLPCMTKFVEARLNDGIAGDVPCPECSEVIPEKDLTKLLPRTVIFKLHARSLEQKAVASGAIQRACPTPNCPMRQVLKIGSCGQDVCSKCNKESCWLCGAQPFHEGRTCEQHAARERNRGKRTDEDSLYEWMEATGTRQCPTCQMGVSKENLQRQTEQRSECHKMLCRNCGTRFCFKCLMVLTEKVSCSCSKSKHGFIDPYTGDRISHRKRGAKVKER
jgi:hypothetical protein